MKGTTVPADPTVKETILTLRRAIDHVLLICDYAEKCHTVLRTEREMLYARVPVCVDFPQSEETYRISARTMVREHEVKGRWSVQTVLYCGNHTKRQWSHVAYLQCDLHHPNGSRYSIHIDGRDDLLKNLLGITERATVYQTFNAYTRLAVPIADRKRYERILMRILQLYAEQPQDLTNPREDEAQVAHH
ncbi:MAG: hypothetical protein KC662_04195 [Candidatus Magasanikbacteria bacterium]|nr:hypothetical protein [Candidatus Magasanikbacteria bacterium]